MLKEVPAWRIAFFHPRIGHWQLGVYEDVDRKNAAAVAASLPECFGITRAELIATRTWLTDHGVNPQE